MPHMLNQEFLYSHQYLIVNKMLGKGGPIYDSFFLFILIYSNKYLSNRCSRYSYGF